MTRIITPIFSYDPENNSFDKQLGSPIKKFIFIIFCWILWVSVMIIGILALIPFKPFTERNLVCGIILLYGSCAALIPYTVLSIIDYRRSIRNNK